MRNWWLVISGGIFVILTIGSLFGVIYLSAKGVPVPSVLGDLLKMSASALVGYLFGVKGVRQEN